SFFTKDDLYHFQREIAATLRPSHSTGPPVKIGTKAHGKLKADQWKAERHITSFGEHMLAYLKGIRRILPGQSLLPSHHNALHIPDFLQRFGPMPGWWMFPFERVIGLLQKVKTNGKIGKKDGIILCLRDSPQL
ncbi:hypothetical protein FOMPIDRAFT_1130286, partial [Fomitopsis schrenkii]